MLTKYLIMNNLYFSTVYFITILFEQIMCIIISNNSILIIIART